MRARGFTLVEVMVALAVVAIALPALLMALYQQVDDTGYLRDKSLAHMVAANKLEEMRIVVAATRNLRAGKDEGQATVADREWFWWLEATATEVDQFFRVEIEVADSEENRSQPLYTLVAFMSADLEMDFQGIVDGQGQGQGQGQGGPGDGAPTGGTPVPTTPGEAPIDFGGQDVQ